MLSRNLSRIPSLASKCLISGSGSQHYNVTAASLFSGLETINLSCKRNLTSKSINQSLELFTNSSRPISLSGNGPFQLNINEERPLTVILAWLMSDRKHIHKYAKYYLDNGFDVLTVRTTPWQLLWPVTGSHIVASDLLSFLYQNPNYYKTVVHGFSVGGYLWGEVMVKMSEDIAKYTPTMSRIVGQIWDSAVDYGQIPIGVPKSVFPTNEFLRKSLERYVVFHMKTYQESSTKHHLKATDQFYQSIIRAPAMFLFSLNDPMVCLKSIETVRDAWQKQGTMVNLRAWHEPPHVGIFQRHPEEYQDEVRKFMEKHVFPKLNKDTSELAAAAGRV